MNSLKLTLILLIVLSFVLIEAKTHKISSNITYDKIVIDGDLDEWFLDDLNILDDETAAGVCNDSDYVYLTLMISDQELQRQIMSMGMTVWFEEKGKKKEKIGVKYPAGMMASGPRDRFDPSEMGEERVRMDPNEMINSMGDEFRLLTNDLEQSKNFSEFPGLEAGISVLDQILIYEIQIPCDTNMILPVMIKPDKDTIHLGVEISGSDQMKMHPPEGFSGDRGGPGGRGQGNRPEMRRPEFKKREFWLKIKLAETEQD